MLLLVLEELIIIIIWGLSTSHTVTYQNQNCGEILQNLEVLHKISAGDFVPSNLLLHQSLWGQQQRHQFGQFTLKIIINV